MRGIDCRAIALYPISSARVANLCRAISLIALALVAASCGSFRSATETPTGTQISTVPPGSAQDFFVNVGDRVFFSENSAEISDTARQTLDKQAAWLLKYSARSVTIEGHADERGNKATNLALGNRRAQAVRNYLVSKGIIPERVKFVSYGRDRRVSTCNNASCWSQNRRAVTVLDGSADVALPGPSPVAPSSRPSNWPRG
jgi:peptidoglycan-associated lipoprotein